MLDLVRDLAAGQGTGIVRLVDGRDALEDAVVGAMS